MNCAVMESVQKYPISQVGSRLSDGNAAHSFSSISLAQLAIVFEVKNRVIRCVLDLCGCLPIVNVET